MADPWVAVGEDGFKMWRVAGNVLNWQSQTSDKGWSSSLWFGRGLTTPHSNRQYITKCYIVSLRWAHVNTNISSGSIKGGKFLD
jgi:hypothetical protein